MSTKIYSMQILTKQQIKFTEVTTEQVHNQTKDNRFLDPYQQNANTNTLSIVLGTVLFVVSLLLMIVLFTKKFVSLVFKTNNSL